MSKAAQEWMERRNWQPAPFQRRAWAAYARGESGLIHAPTGRGKTLAAWLGPLTAGDGGAADRARPEGRVLWITPMRALAADLERKLEEPLAELAPRWSLERRTGDSSSAQRARVRRRMPSALVTTPESLALMLSWPDAAERFAKLHCVVVDEWHELLSTKRGTLTELLLARLRSLAPGLRTWGLSATLGDREAALEALVGVGNPGTLIAGPGKRSLAMTTVLPQDAGRFPWAGHLGLHLLDEVARKLDQAATSLVFTNTRSQAERWFQALRWARPEWEDQLALHHGSLDAELRSEHEARLARGELRAVVSTSSLDLGVDFTPVEQVVQIGSPKGIARLLQRAGRSGHAPGATSRLVCVPTHALEIVEFAAARRALGAGQLEARMPLDKPLDVLAQHLVTAAFGGGFEEREMLAEVRGTAAYRALTDEQWRWALDFVSFGGPALRAYERFARVRQRGQRCEGGGDEQAKLHRTSIGTITSYGSLEVRLLRGGRLGRVEENFLARLAPGEAFTFAGRAVELVKTDDLRAWVRPSKRKQAKVPRWMGGRMPLSSELAGEVRAVLAGLATPGAIRTPELRAVRGLFALQGRASRVPQANELLIERIQTSEGQHAFLYPLEGRLVHEGLGALMAARLADRAPATLTATASDWGLELFTTGDLPDTPEEWRALLSAEGLGQDLERTLDITILARRRFREVARVSGLVHPGTPWRSRSQRDIQSSSGLLWDVLHRHDPENRLLAQAKDEVLRRELELVRLRQVLGGLAQKELVITRPAALTPLAFPLWADRIREHVSSEDWMARVQRAAEQLEAQQKEGRVGSRA